MLDYISALGFLGNPIYWATLLIAVILVGAVGLLPGIGSTTIMVVALPFLVFEVSDPLIGLTFLAAMNGLANTLDSVPAVLLGYPSGATQVTFLEGHQLAMRGQGAYTLGAVYSVSAIGGVVGAITLLIMMPVIKPILVRISFPEIAALGLFGVLMVSALSRGAMLKGLIAGLLGILLGTIGTSYVSGLPRFELGAIYLFDGLPLVPATIGLFALPELIDLTMRGQPVGISGSISNGEVFRGARYGLSRWRMTVRQSLFGVFLGAVPGIGAAVIDWLAYAFGIAFTKDKSNFGKGDLDGVLFAESAQNSKEGGQAVPTLAFGIPGGLQWALVLVAMTIYGVHPGLTMLERDLDVTMSIVVTLALGNLFVTMLGLVATGHLAKLTLIPFPMLAAVLLPVTFVAAYLTTFHWGDILTVCAMFALGMAMKWLGWPRPPLLLGFILGPIIEQNLWPSWQLWHWWFLSRPLTIALVVAAVVSVTYLTRSMGKSSAVASVVTSSPLAPDFGAAPTSLAQGSPPGAPVVLISRESSNVTSEPSMQPPAASLAAQMSVRLPTIRFPALRFSWQWDSVFPVILLGVVAWVVWQAQTYIDPASRFLPTLVGVVLIPCLVFQIAGRSLKPREQGDIMDLGMRTGTGRDAVWKLTSAVAWMAGFVLLIGVIGMPFATIGFALIFGLTQVKLPGRRRLWGALPGAIMAALIYLIFEQLIVIEWPNRVVLIWLGF